MQRKLWFVILGLLGGALIAGGGPASAGPTRLVDVVSDVDANTTLTAPPAASFDISWFDPTTHTYYLADRSNASVDLIDARSGTFIGRIHGFQGVQPAGPGGGGRSGPNGIVVIPAPINQLWAGDGNSTVKVVNLTKGTIINTISTGGNNRADELAYDAKDQILVIANDAETPPFLTFIKVDPVVGNQTIISKLPYPTTTNGIEQPVWSPTTGHFYVAIPQSQTNPGGEIAELDPTTTPPSFVQAFALPSNCIPHGLALGPHPNAIVGCSTPAAANPTLPAGTQIISVILNITNGSTITITDVGGSDEVWYNPGDNRYYLAANTWTTTGKTGAPLNPVLGIIDAGTNTFIANEPTAIGAHSVAVDPFTNQVFVPFPNGAIGIFAGAALAQAQTPVPALDSGQTRLVAVVPDVDQNLALPAPPAASFDISWVDPTTHTYYLADRSNASVDLIDISSAAFLRRITGFRGVQPAGPGGGGRSGPNGIVVIPAPINQLWAGDGDSTVKVVDLTKGAIVNTISTGGNNRADELAYDSADQTLVVANDAESPPFFTFISTVSQTIVAKLPFPDATNGIEQSAWSPTTGLFYVATPATTANPEGELAVLDPKTQSFVPGDGGHFRLAKCTPHGLAIGPHPFAIVGCNSTVNSLIVNIVTGATVATIPQVGGSDEVWYNPGDNRYYLAANANTSTVAGAPGTTLNPVLGIIDAGTNTWLANEPTAIGAHSVAVDPANQAAFVPLPNGAVGIFTRAAFTPGAPLGSAAAGPAGPAGPVGPAGPTGDSGGGCALSPGTAFDPALIGILGLMIVHLGLQRLRRRRGNERSIS